MLSMRFRSQILPLIGRISSTSSLLIRSKIPFLRNFEHSQPKRSYHLTAICQKKAAGKDKDKGKSKGDDEPAVELPEVSTYSKPMDNSVKWFTSELDKIKVGRVNLEIFTELPVETYGTVGKAGQVSLISPTKLRIALFDSAIADAVVQALKNCGMGLNPQVEGGVNITAFIPKPSQESRDLMLKTAAKTAEKVKLDIRNVRKNALDDLKKLKNKISEDDLKRLTKEIDNITQDRANKIDQLYKAKEKEVSAAN